MIHLFIDFWGIIMANGGFIMAFYDELSRYYDDIFPFNSTTYNFLSQRFLPHGKVLDIATGTGNYALALAEEDYAVTAIDLDEKMIQALEDKKSNQTLQLTAKVMNMLDLSLLEQDSYDGAFCIGNSLVHLQTADAIQNALKEIYTLLKSKGQLVLQIVNYDRILRDQVQDLPLISRPELALKFIRKYDLIDHMIHFKTRLIVGPSETYDHVITLYPLCSTELKDLLHKVGFKDIKFYGGFDEQDYEKDSFPLIVTAVK